jgi:hypothetical protein
MENSTELPLPPYPELDVSTYEGLNEDYPPPPSLVNVPEACHIITSYRATVKLRVDQHLFTKERGHQDKVVWRCGQNLWCQGSHR